MTEKELFDLCEDLEKTDTLGGVMSYVLTTSNEWERRVNVPKGTPGSNTSTLRVSPTPPTPRKYVKPENMETLDFLDWLKASSVDELESFAKMDI